MTKIPGLKDRGPFTISGRWSPNDEDLASALIDSPRVFRFIPVSIRCLGITWFKGAYVMDASLGNFQYEVDNVSMKIRPISDCTWQPAERWRRVGFQVLNIARWPIRAWQKVKD